MSDTPDTSELTPGNDNPWYLMMTLYGEQEGEEIDWDLAEKNRRLWNAWICQSIPTGDYAEISQKIAIDVDEMTWTDAKEDEVAKLFAKRANGCKGSLKIPDPHIRVDLGFVAQIV